jgi:uncharacterized protein YbjT (DUF2867 family)
MRVLIVGAGGLIGSAVAARLAAAGHDVVGVGRRSQNSTGSTRPGAWLRLDLARVTDPQTWLAHLAGIDAVVNCAGTLQDAPGQSTAGVHAHGAATLFEACARAGVRRVIHLSAIGVDRAATAFARSKRAGEEALTALDLDWVILRPSVVIGRAAYGGSALLRALAALPVRPVMPATAPLQLVHLDDLVDAILFFLQKGAPGHQTIEVVGPKRYDFDEAVALLRAWMRWPPARAFRVPGWLAAAIYRAGDLVSLLGWLPPIRSTARREIAHGGVGDPAPLTALAGIAPRDLETALAREPASVQERWFARLYLLKAPAIAIFALLWIVTGLVSLGPGFERGVGLVMQGGASRTVAVLAAVSGALADLAIGIAIAFRRTHRLGLLAALVISLAYAIIGTILVPQLWSDPLGPLLKIGPILMLNLMLIAIQDDR